MLNLITDAWIPVRRKDGTRAVIAPWQMADESLAFPDWPRPDLNIACLELLIGLVFIADPPAGGRDWRARQTPDPDRLRARLAPFAPAFELMGEGPRFMQDQAKLEEKPEKEKPEKEKPEKEEPEKEEPEKEKPEKPLKRLPAGRLFIDSGGENTEKNNTDLFVKRDRYGALDPATAAMALFTTQIYAYSDSSKHKASLRGNGPLVTLVDPLRDGEPAGLWPLVWANVPEGKPSDPASKPLPWQRATVSSETGATVPWLGETVAETFFSMPWRIRLIGEEDAITGFVRKDFGNLYGNVASKEGKDGKPKTAKSAYWIHPLTPYRRENQKEPFEPMKAPAGAFAFTNWSGTVIKAAKSATDTARRAQAVAAYGERSDAYHDILVAGWAMNKAKPADFLFARVPVLRLEDAAIECVNGMILAANRFADALRTALIACLPVKPNAKPHETIQVNALREKFILSLERLFGERLAELTRPDGDPQAMARAWLGDMEKAAMTIFRAQAEPLLSVARITPATVLVNGEPREVRGAGDIVAAWRRLAGAFRGHGDDGRAAFTALRLPVPD